MNEPRCKFRLVKNECFFNFGDLYRQIIVRLAKAHIHRHAFSRVMLGQVGIQLITTLSTWPKQKMLKFRPHIYFCYIILPMLREYLSPPIPYKQDTSNTDITNLTQIILNQYCQITVSCIHIFHYLPFFHMSEV